MLEIKLSCFILSYLIFRYSSLKLRETWKILNIYVKCAVCTGYITHTHYTCV